MTEPELIEELLERCIVANDWLADKGIPIDHVELIKMRKAIKQAQDYLDN